jgi:hypothetical protein
MFTCPICLCETRGGALQCHSCCFPNFRVLCEDGLYNLFPHFNFARGGDEKPFNSPPTKPGVLPRFQVTVADPPQTCPICLSDDMYSGVRLGGCGHMFHEECIETWLEKEATCPVCRAQTIK